MSEEEILKECTELAENEHHELGDCWDEEYSSSAIFGLIMLYKQTKKELNNLKEIEKSHQEENGKLRVELEQEKEKNKELEYQNKILQEKNQDYKCNYDTIAKQKEALEKQHEYDMQMIDEVKGNAVKWANELEQEKEKNMQLNQEILIYKNAVPNQYIFFDYSNYISKDKIKEKIEELEKECKQYEEMTPSARRYDGIQKIDIQINILNDLLEV